MASPMDHSLNILTNYIQHLVKEASEAQTTEDEMVTKSLATARSLFARLNGCDFSSEQLKDILKEYSKAVLDFTFCEEKALVDAEFPEGDGRQRLQSLLDFLSRPEQLTAQLLGDSQSLLEILGSEITECIYWRKGALLYMYCATIIHDQRNRIDNNKVQYLEDLLQGIVYLQSMLATTEPIGARENVVTQHEDAYQLLAKGIASDSHLLALMYAGEMCYWYQTAYDSSDQAVKTEVTAHFDARAAGVKMLITYAEAVQGPLKDSGWTCNRAQELLKSLKT